MTVLVVSNFDLPHNMRVMKPAAFLEASIKDTTLNLSNEYRYMKLGYYVSMHAEILGNQVIPSCENIIDSSRTPILLLRTKKAGVPTLPFLVTDSVKKIVDELGFPVILFAVNPFIYDGYNVASNKSSLYRAMKSLGMNYKFAVCAQPLVGKLQDVKCFFGKAQSEDSQVQEIAKQVFSLIKIPVCKLLIQKSVDKAYLCGLQPVSRQELSETDLQKISKEVMLISEQGEPFGV